MRIIKWFALTVIGGMLLFWIVIVGTALVTYQMVKHPIDSYQRIENISQLARSTVNTIQAGIDIIVIHGINLLNFLLIKVWNPFVDSILHLSPVIYAVICPMLIIFIWVTTMRDSDAKS